MPELRERRSLKSLGRGAAILSAFTPVRSVLGISEIADELAISRSIVHRYVITLVALGYLEQSSSRKYRLGPRVADPGSAAIHSSGLREHARSHLQGLRRRTSLTAGLGVLDGGEVLYVDRMCSLRGDQNETDLSLRAGSRVPAYSSAGGKLLLAHLPEAQQRALISSSRLAGHAAHTITGGEALRREFEAIRQAGFASDEQLAAGLVAIAAPVRNNAGEVIAALELTERRALMSSEELADSLAAHLRASADRISAEMRYRRNGKLAVEV
jgi:IclR family pca regulon transcriptional regulator